MRKQILYLAVLLVVCAIGILSLINLRYAVSNLYTYYLQKHYPLKYSEQIISYSGQFNLDPSLVSAVIYEESRFNPDAVSEKGARGLMQIMPETEWFIYSKIDPPTRSSMMADINDQIRYGSYYLSYLFDKYDNWEYALAAYNAGGGNVDEWLKEGDFDIKFAETKSFVKKVKDSEKMYKRLYFKE